MSGEGDWSGRGKSSGAVVLIFNARRDQANNLKNKINE